MMLRTLGSSRSLFRSSVRFASAGPTPDDNTKPKQSSILQEGHQWQASQHDSPWMLRGASGAKPSLPEKAVNLASTAPQELASAMLPHGYPSSVKDGYDKYVIGQMAGAITGSASGVFSMQALLYAVGLGQGAIPMAAALNWVIKDGLGQLGGVLAVHLVNTKFDSDPRRWRLISSVALDASSFMELVSPLAPALFIPIAATANVGKNVSWLAASASRAAIHNSFARSDNLADVTAKAGSQSIAASLVGTSLGVALSAQLGSEWGPTTLATFATLSSIHLGCTYLSLKYVRLETLNSQRLDLVLQAFLTRRGLNHTNKGENTTSTENKGAASTATASAWLPSPAEVADLESFVPTWPLRGSFHGPGLSDWLLLAPPLPSLAQTPRELDAFRAALRSSENGGNDKHSNNSSNYSECGYVLSVHTRQSVSGKEEAQIALALDVPTTIRGNATEEYSESVSTLRGVLHASILRRTLGSQGIHISAPGLISSTTAGRSSLSGDGDANQWAARPDLVKDTALLARIVGVDFFAGLKESEWKADVLHVDNGLATRAIRQSGIFLE